MKNVESYTRDELMDMPLIALRGLDIESPEQEMLVQEIVNIKLATLPIQQPIFRNDVPDIQTPQEEARWQEIMNRRERKIRGEDVGQEPPIEQEPVPEVTTPTFNPETQPLAQPTGEGDPVSFKGGVVKDELLSKPVRKTSKRK